MPTIAKCKECGRKGGYGTDEAAAVCARCEQGLTPKENNANDES